MIFFACDNATPAIMGTPTPSASPTPLPEQFVASVTETMEPVSSPDPSEEDYSSYLSYGDIRIYEYGDDTFMDGVCINAYPSPLAGRTDIVFYGSDGRKLGDGAILTADGTNVFMTGSNNIYAEIGTDIDVQMLDFVLEIKQAYAPVSEDTPQS